MSKHRAIQKRLRHGLLSSHLTSYDIHHGVLPSHSDGNNGKVLIIRMQRNCPLQREYRQQYGDSAPKKRFDGTLRFHRIALRGTRAASGRAVMQPHVLRKNQETESARDQQRKRQRITWVVTLDGGESERFRRAASRCSTVHAAGVADGASTKTGLWFDEGRARCCSVAPSWSWEEHKHGPVFIPGCSIGFSDPRAQQERNGSGVGRSSVQHA